MRTAEEERLLLLRLRVGEVLELHPRILEKNGKKEFVIMPYEEFEQNSHVPCSPVCDNSATIQSDSSA
jgi:hypothetical protein